MRARFQLISSCVALIVIILTGITGLMIIEHWNLLDASWVTIISLTTTGFSEIIPQTVGGKIFLMLLILLGVGVFTYAIGSIISIAVESQISLLTEKNRMKDKINSLHNHIIVCGAGRVGQAAAEVLKHQGVPHVLIDHEPELIHHLQSQNILCLVGDASDDQILIEAGIKRARGVISALSDDAYNVYVTLTARALNPQLEIVARAEKPESVEKLYRAGAQRVVPSAQIAGQRMGTAIVKPTTLDLFESLVHSQHFSMEIRELMVEPNSLVVGSTIKQVFRHNQVNVMCVAVVHQQGETMVNPAGHTIIEAGDILVVIGPRQDIDSFEGSYLSRSTTHSSS
ncbi:MAG: potassium channel family protein [Methylocystaceae bacterium]